MGILPDINGMTEDQFKMWTAQKLVDLKETAEQRRLNDDVAHESIYEEITKINAKLSAMQWWNRGSSFVGGIVGGVAATLGLKQTGV